ncbi:MAG: alpha/beta hydrolase [Solirubrobacterales bacterium]
MTEPGAVDRARRPELERAFQHLADLISAADVSGVSDLDEQGLRIAREYAMPRYGDVGPAISLDGVTFTPVSAGGVRAVWVTAAGASHTRRIVYIHGGGWRSGSPDHYRGFAATLARQSGASILMVDYRLAPEHRFPAALDDCVKAYAWALDNGPESRRSGRSDADPAEEVFMAGDSAGGNLSAAACLRLCAAGARVPDRLVLIAGTLDNVETERRVGLDDPICEPEALAICTKMYLPVGHSPADPYVSPVFADGELLARFPPTLLQVSAIEALAWDSKRFATRLEDAGVRVTLSMWPELPHVWHMFLGLFDEAHEALAEIGDFLDRNKRKAQ